MIQGYVGIEGGNSARGGRGIMEDDHETRRNENEKDTRKKKRSQKNKRRKRLENRYLALENVVESACLREELVVPHTTRQYWTCRSRRVGRYSSR